MKQFHKGYDYFTGPKENLDQWQKSFRLAVIQEESGIGKTENIEKWSMLKINDEEEAAKLTEQVVESMGWEVDSDNWHSFIGPLMERTNNKLDGKIARKCLQNLVEKGE